ncbi:MAG TPA: hypothetical protein VKV96_07150 [Roseiarcus sp.]|nr:hypothetical protein [Roseiarcus sp.]
MAKEPENLVLEHLRVIRAEVKEFRGEMTNELREVRAILGEHTRRFDFLEERVEMLREGTMTAIGFAASTGEYTKKLEKQIADLTKRVEKLEQAK